MLYRELFKMDTTSSKWKGELMIKGFNFSIVKIEVESTDFVAQLKLKINDCMAIHPNNQKLLYGLKNLKDWDTIGSYGIIPGDKIEIIFK